MDLTWFKAVYLRWALFNVWTPIYACFVCYVDRRVPLIASDLMKTGGMCSNLHICPHSGVACTYLSTYLRRFSVLVLMLVLLVRDAVLARSFLTFHSVAKLLNSVEMLLVQEVKYEINLTRKRTNISKPSVHLAKYD